MLVCDKSILPITWRALNLTSCMEMNMCVCVCVYITCYDFTGWR